MEFVLAIPGKPFGDMTCRVLSLQLLPMEGDNSLGKSLNSPVDDEALAYRLATFEKESLSPTTDFARAFSQSARRMISGFVRAGPLFSQVLKLSNRQ